MNELKMQDLSEEEFINAYKEQWKDTPYPVIFTTVDALLYYEDHFLMIKRKGHPYKGKWALPGGFLDVNETINEGALRELMEEVSFSQVIINQEGFPKKDVKDLISVKNVKVLDKPDRDPRGRFISHLVEFKGLNRYVGECPSVKGTDDAAEAKWISIDDILNNPQDIAFDHWHVIHSMIEGFVPNYMHEWYGLEGYYSPWTWKHVYDHNKSLK